MISDREALEPDGSLRDIYIKNVDLRLWQILLDHLTARYRTKFVWPSGRMSKVPPISEIFSDNSGGSPVLKVHLGGLTLNVHFFQPDEIELDLDPRELNGPADVDAVLGFIAELGDLLAREVILTPEGGPKYPIYRFRPGQDRPEYVPPRPR